MIRSPTLDRPEAEFFGFAQGDGLATPRVSFRLLRPVASTDPHETKVRLNLLRWSKCRVPMKLLCLWSPASRAPEAFRLAYRPRPARL